MWQSIELTYRSLNNEAIKQADEQLQLEYNELKREIETNELTPELKFLKPFSSIKAPKEPKLLEKERRLYFEKILNVLITLFNYFNKKICLNKKKTR
jgi:hypothetical protein